MSETHKNSLSSISQVLNERLLDEGEALFSIANALYRVKRFDDANTLLPTALDLIAKAPPSSRREELLALLETMHGMTISAGDDNTFAEQQFTSAANRFTSIENHLGHYLALVSEGIRLQDSKQPHKALHIFKEAEAIDQAYNVARDSVDRYKLQCNITGVLVALGDTNILVQQITDALKWIPLEPCEELFALFIQKGNYCTLYGDFDAALESYNSALTTAKELGRQELHATSLARIALCYRTWWEQSHEANLLEKSISFRRDAAHLYSKIGFFEESLGQWQEIISAYQKIEQLPKAREASLQALSLATKGELSEQVFRFSAHAAFLTTALKEYEQALDLYLIAYKAIPPNQHDAHRVTAEIARLYYALGNVDSALEWFEKSCELLAQLGDIKREIEERQIVIYLLNKLSRPDDLEKHVMRLKQLGEVGAR